MVGFDIDGYVPGLDQEAPAIHWRVWWDSSKGATLDLEEGEVRILKTVSFLLERAPTQTALKRVKDGGRWPGPPQCQRSLDT